MADWESKTILANGEHTCNFSIYLGQVWDGNRLVGYRYQCDWSGCNNTTIK